MYQGQDQSGEAGGLPWQNTSRGQEANSPFLEFDCRIAPVVGRIYKNKLLGIVTLGFYRFWGKTHLRRLLWNGTRLGEDRLEYHGTGKELFIGFLIALVILTPLLFVVGVVSSVLALTAPALEIIGSLLNFAVLFAFWQFARYRLWRYRLSRTSWRSIRFYLEGKGLRFMGISLLWTLASLFSLGLLYPVLRQKLLDYQINNTVFGDQNFRFTGTAGGMFKTYLPFILSNAFLLSGAILYFVFYSPVTFSDLGGGEMASYEQTAATGEFSLILMGVALLSMIFMVMGRVHEIRFMAANMSFGEARFRSELPVSRVLLVFIIMGVLTIVAYGALFMLLPQLMIADPIMMIVLVLVFFVVIYLLFDVLKTVFLVMPLMRLFCRTLYITDISSFETVAARSGESPRYGEGLADALDVGAF
ncbi:YjgN family protein [Sneathiella chinensis]|uniref:Membrane protein n=1 Tax=Sneathiella chinensis TaxID=349750 RepID=A0ABQ5U6Y6_9PROT|nr:DUF898 family protein [Sneathiella chinensis]GLQ07679.1 membrane protein [Sneathiella chinensis]